MRSTLLFRAATLRLLATIALLLSVWTSAVAQDANQDQEDRSSIDPAFIEQVRQVLLAHPEILEEAFEVLQQRRNAEASNQRQQVIAQNRALIFNSDNQVVIGNPDGDVTLVEFFDYNCGFCRRAAADLTELLKTDLNLRVVLKEFPILGQASVEAARISVAVAKLAPDRYKEFHFALLGGGARVDGALALTTAEQMGLSRDDILAASKPEIVDAGLAEVRAMTSALNITGTPAFILGTEIIEGAVGADSLRDMIAAMRACGATHCN